MVRVSAGSCSHPFFQPRLRDPKENKVRNWKGGGREKREGGNEREGKEGMGKLRTHKICQKSAPMQSTIARSMQMNTEILRHFSQNLWQQIRKC